MEVSSLELRVRGVGASSRAENPVATTLSNVRAGKSLAAGAFIAKSTETRRSPEPLRIQTSRHITLRPLNRNHLMLVPTKIQFQELSTCAAEFLHELNDPSLLRSQQIPPAAQRELKKQQVLKLRLNIAILVAKREEFNRKMEDYTRNLEALIRSLEKSMGPDSLVLETSSRTSGERTRVRCLSCESEEIFKDLQIIFAKESDESMALPTQVYVLTNGVLKKGQFTCGLCGTERLVIRAC